MPRVDGWGVYLAGPGEVHVIPEKDRDPHEEYLHCRCEPRSEEVGVRIEGEVRTVVIHNAFDGREIWE